MLGELSKLGLVEESFIPTFRLVGPGPVVTAATEVGPVGLESQPLFEESGPNEGKGPF